MQNHTQSVDRCHAIDDTPIEDAAGAQGMDAADDSDVNNVIYLAHCLRKARYLQLCRGSLLSFNSTLKSSLAILNSTPRHYIGLNCTIKPPKLIFKFAKKFPSPEFFLCAIEPEIFRARNDFSLLEFSLQQFSGDLSTWSRSKKCLCIAPCLRKVALKFSRFYFCTNFSVRN